MGRFLSPTASSDYGYRPCNCANRESRASVPSAVEVWAGKEHKRDQNRPCSNDRSNLMLDDVSRSQMTNYRVTGPSAPPLASTTARPALRSLITNVLFSPNFDHGPRGT